MEPQLVEVGLGRPDLPGTASVSPTGIGLLPQRGIHSNSNYISSVRVEKYGGTDVKSAIDTSSKVYQHDRLQTGTID